MNTITALDAEEFDASRFFATFWRRAPVVVRGGGGWLLDRRWSDADFDAAYETLRAKGLEAKERPGEVCFIEAVSDHDPRLGAECERARRTFGAPKAWFDAVRTYGPSGIGAHFDHSDNFVLQQDGVKRWRLASPAHLDEADVARRMLNMPGAGGCEIPDDVAVEAVLDPGDLLYIPLLWPHSGVSEASSLSVSLVCPALSTYAVVVPFLGPVLKSLALGHEPAPALHAYLTPDQRRDALEEIDRNARALLEGLGGDDVARLLALLWKRRLPGADDGVAEPAVD